MPGAIVNSLPVCILSHIYEWMTWKNPQFWLHWSDYVFHPISHRFYSKLTWHLDQWNFYAKFCFEANFCVKQLAWILLFSHVFKYQTTQYSETPFLTWRFLSSIKFPACVLPWKRADSSHGLDWYHFTFSNSAPPDPNDQTDFPLIISENWPWAWVIWMLYHLFSVSKTWYVSGLATDSIFLCHF